MIGGIDAWQPVGYCAFTEWWGPLHDGHGRIAQRLPQRVHTAGGVRPGHDQVVVLKELNDAPVFQAVDHDLDLELFHIERLVVQQRPNITLACLSRLGASLVFDCPDGNLGHPALPQRLHQPQGRSVMLAPGRHEQDLLDLGRGLFTIQQCKRPT